MINSYSKIYQLGHRETLRIFNDHIVIEEKVDGSQISFGLNEQGELFVKSKNRQQSPGMNKMFDAAFGSIQKRIHLLHPGWTYRGEYLSKPKHNTLAYDRVPHDNIVIFDIDRGMEDYITDRTEKEDECKAVGLECVPVLLMGYIDGSPELMADLLNTTSFLGGVNIEGFVIKQYNQLDLTGKTVMAKYVSEEFKEKHQVDFKNRNPNGKDFLAQLIQCYTTKARWTKAVQHLREAGMLKGEPCDIGPLVKEIQRDTAEECAEEIAMRLLKWAEPHIKRGIVKGFPEWYKMQLANRCFEGE